MEKMTEILNSVKDTEEKLSEETRQRIALQEIVNGMETRLANLEAKDQNSETELKTVATTAVETYMQEYPALNVAQNGLIKQ